MPIPAMRRSGSPPLKEGRGVDDRVSDPYELAARLQDVRQSRTIVAAGHPSPTLPSRGGSGSIVGLAAIIVFAALVGCSSRSSVSPAKVAHKTAPADPWVMTCLDPTEPNPALLWNGRIGIRIGRDGTGSAPMFLIDEYDTAGEEKIRELKNPFAGQWTAGADGVPLSPAGSEDYQQELEMKSGLLTTRWSQTIARSHVEVECVTAIHPLRRELSQRWTIHSDSYIPIMYGGGGRIPLNKAGWLGQNHFEWALPPSGAAITESDEVGPDNRHLNFADKVTSDWSPGVIDNASDLGHPLTFARILDIEPSPNGATMDAVRQADSSRSGASSAGQSSSKFAHSKDTPLSFDSVLAASKAAWAKRWKTEIEIDGPVEDQQAVHSFLFYLRSAIDPSGEMSISPFGLSSSQYNGHVFWDADIWVFPALALIEPEEAKAIASYRLGQEGAAEANFQEWLTRGRPTENSKLGALNLSLLGYKFPWESSVTGKETVLGPSRFEEHINGDVPWMLGQATVLGLIPESQFERAVEGAGSYWMERSEPGAPGTSIPQPPSSSSAQSSLQEEGGVRVIRGVMSPDENHVGDDDLYTNLLAQWCVDGGHWLEDEPLGRNYQPPVFKLPRDNVSFLTYDDDPVKSYKQAAAILSIYPLQYPPAEKEAKVMMDRFADKVIPNGPAMSDSLDALIWARLGETDRAYETWERSWRDFVKEPFLQFSEKRNKTSTYFTTGAAGCLQTLLYGFLGFRIDSKKQDGAKWSTPLALGKILSVRPNLPKQWTSVKLRNFIVNGRRYTLTATHQGVTVTQGDR